MKPISLLVFFASLAFGQTQTRTSPDCFQAFSITSVTTSGNLNNIVQIAQGQSTGGCSYWIFTVDGYNTPVATVQFESSAESNAAGTAPSSFVAFAGAISSGTNPTSTFPATIVATGYYPWLRVNVTGYTSGTVRGSIQGWREQTATGGGGGGSTTVTNLTACQDSSKTFALAAIDFTTAATQQIVALSGTTVIHVCSLSLAAGSATNISLVYGTGSACGTGTTSIDGANGGYQSVLSMALDVEFDLPSGKAFCIVSSNAVTVGGFVKYTQF